MFSSLLCITMSITPLPNNFILKTLFSENPIHFHFQVVRGVHVTVKIHGTSRFQHAIALFKPFSHPTNIVIYSTFPAVSKRTNFSTIFPNYFVMSIGKERRVWLYQNYTFLTDEET